MTTKRAREKARKTAAAPRSSGASGGRPAWLPAWRHVVVVVVAVILGLAVGVAAAAALPAGGVFAADRARHALAADSAASLARAAAIADGDDTALNGVGALARVLLWLDHGAVDAERGAAEKLLAKAPPLVQREPEALYARALLASLAPAQRPVVDAKLAADLAAAPESTWVLLARALRDDDGERRGLLERAAFAGPPSAHATHVLARWLVAVGDLPGARATLHRLFRIAPRHALGATTALVVGALESMAAAGDGKAPAKRPAASADEQRVARLVEEGVDDLDGDTLALAQWVTALSRDVDVAPELMARVAAAAARSDVGAERVLEVQLLEGDAASAAALAKSLVAPTRLSFLLDVSRARYLGAVPDDERRAALKAVDAASTRSIDGEGIHLPLGRLAFASLTRPLLHGLPWSALPDPGFYPERRYLVLAGAVAAGAREKVDERLAVIEKLRLAERALVRGDLPGALAVVVQAREQGGASADVALTEAAVRARQNDAVGLKAAVEAAIAAAPDDPSVLLTAARLFVDVDNLAAGRRALVAFQRQGLKSATASAVQAILDARAGDVTAARAAIAEARRLGGADDVVLLRATVLASRNVAPDEARAAAEALRQRNDGGGGDVVAAWVAEAWFRAGDEARAEAALRAIVGARPALADAHLFLAETIAFHPAKKQEAFAHALSALDTLERGPLVEEAKSLALSLKKR